MDEFSHLRFFSQLLDDRPWNTLRKRQTYRKEGPIGKWVPSKDGAHQDGTQSHELADHDQGCRAPEESGVRLTQPQSDQDLIHGGSIP
jgi:hypothetical protein